MTRIREFRAGREVLIDLGTFVPGVICRRVRPKLNRTFIVRPAFGAYAGQEIEIHKRHLRLDLNKPE